MFPIELNKKVTILVASIATVALLALMVWFWYKAVTPPAFVDTGGEVGMNEAQGEESEVDTSEWEVYRNEEWGLRIEHPRYVDANYSGNYCYAEKINDFSPLAIFEKEGDLYVRTQYFYVKDGGNSCKKVERTPSDIDSNDSPFIPWKIEKFNNINNDNALEDLLKQRYGAGCRLGGKEKIDDYTYQVEILSDGKSLGESLCPLNYWSVVLYNPPQNQVVSWHVGQECYLRLDEERDCIDNEIKVTFTE